jgi:hypothetical protein
MLQFSANGIKICGVYQWPIISASFSNLKSSLPMARMYLGEAISFRPRAGPATTLMD